MEYIEVKKGDLTKFRCDAIVNPANSSCSMGGGVALAIKRAGGAEIEREAMAKAPVAIGRAIATTAGSLPARYVIHAPTMRAPGATTLRNVELATKAALRCARELNCESIAFPGMGTGVGGLDYRLAARTMVRAIREFLASSQAKIKVYLVAFNDELYDAFKDALANRI